VRIVAALVSAAVVGVTIYAAGGSPVGAAPSAAKAKAVPASKISLDGRKGDARISATGKPAAGEPGQTRSTPALPKSGKIAALIQLTTPSTLSAYSTASPKGKAAASAAAKSQFTQIKAAQTRVTNALPSTAPGSRVLYKSHSAVAGVAVYTDVKNFPKLKKIAGVLAVYPISPKKASNSYAVPLVGAPAAWTAYGDLGQNSTIAIIDTGIDYTHANFGGPGTPAAYDAALAADASNPDPALFPNDKIIGGTDLVGDEYDADSTDPAHANPVPDPNPLDCGGHGSHVAGTAAGLGIDSAGHTYAGAYNSSTPFSTLRIGPGMAPKASLYAYKVFGCEGSTNVVGAAIDLAGDPNQDGDPSDHADVINMSLGADFGSPDDGDSVATNAAVDKGINVVIASGNAGDYYDIGGSPGDAVKAITAANTVDAYNQIDHLAAKIGGAAAVNYGAERSVAYDWATKPDLAGAVVALTQTTNKDGCDVLNAADAAAVAGKIAFLEWTDTDSNRRCGSVARSGNVAAAGATGFIFADDAETFAAGITGSATIPGVMVIKSAGDALRAALGTGVTVTGTGANDFQQVLPADNDKVNSSSSRGVRLNGNVKPDVGAVGTSVFSTAVGTGNEGVAFTGTSMATPMIAGLAALVNSRHPDWTPQEVKADIMNTAGQDLYTGDNHTGDKFAPNRVGAGRINAKSALDNEVVAYVVDNPGAVSVSFGPVSVTGPMTLTKTVKVVNKSLTAASYNLSYEAITSVPGVSYTVSPSSVLVDRKSSKTFTVSFVVTDPSQLTKTIDPTMDRAQSGLPRNYLADASGRVVLTPAAGGSRPALRVPVYSAPRPASTMTQPASLTLPAGTIQNADVVLSGNGVTTPEGTPVDEAIQSIVAGFELQAKSGLSPQCSATVVSGCLRLPEERAADIKYIGTTSDAPALTAAGEDPLNGLGYFAISTQGPWQTEATKQEFDIYIDSTGDNVPDAVLFNTRLSAQDIFVSQLIDLNTGDVLDVEAINNQLGSTDMAEFDSDTLFMPFAVSALPGIAAGHSRIKYGVLGFSAFSAAPIDMVGLDDEGNFSNPLSFDLLRPGIAVLGDENSMQSADLPVTSLTIRRDAPAYAADKGLGALMVHFHNKVGNKAQVVALKSASQVKLTLSATTVRAGTAVNANVAVTNTAGPVATGAVSVRRLPGAILVNGTLANGKATIRLPKLAKGKYTIYVYYQGDANYLASYSNQIVLTVT
jgi:subtilisin family serine protease